ncbi:MAG: nucleoside-diphosphate kinase [Flavobacteriales bacterium]
MAGNITLTMIKPEAVEKGYTGKILDMIIEAGFDIVAMKKTVMSKDEAKEFYKVHKDRPFYEDLTDYMSNSPIIAAVLKKDNAVEDLRGLIGATDPSEAEEGTIRSKYAASKAENAVHGSDSDENADIEASFFFPKREWIV